MGYYEPTNLQKSLNDLSPSIADKADPKSGKLYTEIIEESTGLRVGDNLLPSNMHWGLSSEEWQVLKNLHGQHFETRIAKLETYINTTNGQTTALAQMMRHVPSNQFDDLFRRIDDLTPEVRSTFFGDCVDNADFVKGLGGKPELVGSWKKLFKSGNSISDRLRTDSKVIRWFSRNSKNIANDEVSNLLTNLDGKIIERTFEDLQGRLVIITESSNSTRTVVTVERVAKGEVKSFKYTNAYNKAGRPGKPPISENGLTPDFSGNTDWLYPVTGDQKNIVKIKLSGKRKGTDGGFHRANQKAGFSTTKAPKGYTWHHMDDFDPATGECTMQLVNTSDHTGSLPHTGSVKQYENYSGTKYAN